MISHKMDSHSPKHTPPRPICRWDAHQGQPVSCLEFNPQKTSLLGTGGCDGTVQVVNIDRPNSPDVFHNVTTTKHASTEVLCISWNRKVQHILATASNQGLTVVWDLKNKKEVISFKDPSNRSRCSALSWNPDIPTQLLVAYNDDANPCIQLWDMRNCSYPFKEFQQHSRGVTAASYCDHDSNLIVSSGRDNRTICWSINTDQIEPYAEINLGSPATKIDWSPHLPGLLATSTTTTAVSVHSVLQRQTPAASRYSPKWAQIPCGVSFGFGGKVVMFGKKLASHLQIHIVPDEPSIAHEADKFETFLSSDLRPFCSTMHESTSDEHEKITWKLLSIISNSPSDRRSIASAFGIDVADVKLAIDKYIGRNINNTMAEAVEQDLKQTEVHAPAFADPTSLDPDQLDNLFDQLARNTESQQQLAQPVPPVPTGSRRGTPRARLGEEIGDLTDWSQGTELLIKQAILVGDFEGAVECCMRCGKFADALLLAASGSPDLWQKTRDEYTRKQKDPFVRKLGFILSQDLEKLVYHSDLSEWPETLALLTTYARNDNYAHLVELLAGRLEKESFDVRSAVLCYLACGSFDNTIRIWASMSHAQTSQYQALQGLVEKMSCLYAAIRPQTAGPIFSSKVTQYATLLANSGRTLAAMRFLMLIPDSVDTKILKDRIFNAAPSVMSQLMQKPPPFPFDYMDIRAPHMPSQPAHTGSGLSQAQPSTQSQIGSGRIQTQYQPQQTLYQGRNSPLQPTVQPAFPTRSQVVPGTSNAPVGTNGVHPAIGTPQGQHFQHALQQPQGLPQSHQHFATPLINPGPTSMGSNPTQSHVAQSSPIPSSRQPNLTATAPAPQRPVTTPVGHQSIPQRSLIPPANPGNVASPRSISQMPQATAHAASHAAPVVAVTPQQQPHFPQRAVVGPPTSGGVSTAPHVTARSVTAGMPVPWPVPTAVQQQLTPNSVAPPAGAPSVSAQISEPMSSGEVAAIQNTLNGLLRMCAQDGNTRKWEDTGRKLGDLYDKLANGQLTKESKDKVKDLIACIDRGDYQHASRIRVELSASDWERNRTWLFALQLLLPK